MAQTCSKDADDARNLLVFTRVLRFGPCVIGQVLSDALTSFANQKVTKSNWQTYAGAAIGGAVGGVVLSLTGSTDLASAASGFATTGTGLFLEKVSKVSDKSWAEIGVNALADAAISFGLGKILNIKGISKGRNSKLAVYKSGLTKLKRKIVAKMSLKVVGKGLVYSFVSGLAMDGYYGVKQYGYDRVKRLFLK